MTKADLQKYILNSLGSPVINVELTPDQIDMCINDATQMFVESHYDGTDLSYIGVNVSVDVQTYTLPDNVFEVLKVLNTQNNIFVFDEPLLLTPNYGNSITPDVVSLDVKNIEALRHIFKTAERTYNYDILFDFNSTTKKLFFHAKPRMTGIYICEVQQSETDLTKYYNNIWLKRYSTALCRKLLSINVGKYSGSNLPGGVSVDYQRMAAEAQQEIDKLELQLRDKYESTASFFIG